MFKEKGIEKNEIYINYILLHIVQMMYFMSISVCEDATSGKTEREDFERRRKCW